MATWTSKRTPGAVHEGLCALWLAGIAAMLNKISLRGIAIVLTITSVAVATTAALTMGRTSQTNAAVQHPQIGARFELSLPDGRAVTNETFRGKWLVIYFGYTSCPDVCPTTLVSVAQALKSLGPAADKVQPIFITVDPERDTPEIIGEYVKFFDPRFVGLVGSPQQTADAARDFHVYYVARQLGNNEYVIDHSSYLYVVDPKGTFVRLLSGDLPGHELSTQLAKLMN
jgi:protein SCO1